MVNVSVVLPVFNGAAQLPATLASILDQTLDGVEVIVVDDGSTDDTPAVLARYGERLRVIRQENAGITRALIAGCAAARAPLIARHDCGDRSHPERLAKQRALFDNDAVVLAGAATTYVAPGGEPLYTIAPDGAAVRESLLHADVATIRGLPHHGSAMFRREAYEAVGGYRAEFYFAQDVDLWMRLAARGHIAVNTEPLYEASLETRAISSRHREEQIASARVAIALRDGGDAQTLLAEAARIRPSGRKVRRGVAEAKALYFIASCLRRNGDPAWRRYLGQAMRAVVAKW
jgi:glycosyltransferase involved in cell wall biosynthesis